MPHALLERFRAAQVIPVVRTRSARTAMTAVEWLHDAGLRIFEITMTVPDATALIRDLATDKSAGRSRHRPGRRDGRRLYRGRCEIHRRTVDRSLTRRPVPRRRGRAHARRRDPDRGTRGAGGGRRRGQDFPRVVGWRAWPCQSSGQRVSRRRVLPDRRSRAGEFRRLPNGRRGVRRNGRRAGRRTPHRSRRPRGDRDGGAFRDLGTPRP